MEKQVSPGKEAKKRGRPIASTNDRKSYGPLGDIIRDARRKFKMGLAEVAEACDCSVQFISNIEHGRAPLPWDKAKSLASVLKISLSEIEAANLAIRSDFRSFLGATLSGGTGNRVKKSATALANYKDTASLVALTAKDDSIREILTKYYALSAPSKKKFYASAKRLLAE